MNQDKLNPLEKLVQSIFMKHYDQIYKELASYEKMLNAQTNPDIDNAEDKNEKDNKKSD